MDHVLVDTGGAQPDHAGDCVVMLKPAVATPPDAQAALKHDDDLRDARLDFAEVAFGVMPALRE